MLNKHGFDLWADVYDKSVQLSEESNLYPFAGYKAILNTIFNEIMKEEHSKVLDIGFGTGVLTNELYKNGHQIDGLDFSTEMIDIAQSKMPTANLIEWDITQGLPKEILNKNYDAIVSTYALHHLTDKSKLSLIKTLLSLLSENGKIFIGDIAFQTRNDLEVCKQASKEYWDDKEFYFVADEIQASLPNECTCMFNPISHCGGVFVLS